MQPAVRLFSRNVTGHKAYICMYINRVHLEEYSKTMKIIRTIKKY